MRPDGSPRFTNRLLLESSPYLRQHAHNPVNWYPWGDEAFADARRLGRPVLLSIGYSTCHWCHVMEEESFEDEEIARVLNERYVAIKVDREQRPDLDSIYMTAVVAATGGGGWPMTVWLTPAREPFYAGTYFPARDGDRGSSPGFLSVLEAVEKTWRTRADDVAGAAADLSARVRGELAASSGAHDESVDIAALAADALDKAASGARARYDPENGGTRGARKFPTGLPLRALLRYARRSGDAETLAMVTNTLEHMAAGGIRDHLAGGFHRYSVDPAWRVPHFEKMLYDNALLTMTYTEASQATGRADFAEVAREIVAWVGREMTAPDGAFYSATDADSRSPDGKLVEGWFFTWTAPEIDAALGGDDARLFDAAYGVRAGGGGGDSGIGELDGRSVLHVASSPADLAREFSTTEEAVRSRLETSRARLLGVRERRPRPLRDEKILTTWNALMISAAARVAMAQADPAALSLARRAADALREDRGAGTPLVHSRVGARTQPDVFLEDYAFTEAALLDLFEADSDDRRLAQAVDLDRIVEKEFEDPAGGFFRTPAGKGDLLVREKSLHDGVEPSGSSVAILNLLRLAEWTGDEKYRARAGRALASLSASFQSAPLALADGLLALDFASDAAKEIVLVTAAENPDLAAFEAVLAKTFVPNRVVLRVTGRAPRTALPLAERKVAIDGKPTAYVCEGRICDLPATDAATFASELGRIRPLRPVPSR